MWFTFVCINQSKAGFIESYVDSLIGQYESNNADDKPNAAIALWSLFHIPNHREMVVDPLISDIDYKVLTAYIEIEIQKPGNEDLELDYELIKLRFLEETSSYAFNLQNMNNEQLAIYHFAKVPKVDFFYASNYDHISSLHKSLKYAEKSEKTVALQTLLLHYIGGYYFHTEKLDSALNNFEKQHALVEEYGIEKCGYVPGLGTHINGYDELAHASMNFGLCHDKLGNLFSAIQLYDKGLEYYNKCGSVPGINWGMSQLNNAFLDMGDYAHSGQMFVEAFNYWKKDDNPAAVRNNMLSFLSEYTIYDFKNTAVLIDSILKTTQVSFGRSLNKYAEIQYLGEMRYLTYKRIAANYANTEFDDTAFLNRIQQITTEQINATDATPEMHSQMLNSVQCLHLAWQIAFDKPNNATLFAELEALLIDENQLFTNQQITKLVWAILHANHKHKEELVLIKQKIGEIESNGFIIDLRKLYYQISKAYEYMGNIDSAYVYYKKYDELKEQTQTLNQHAQLAALDKRLEVEKERTKTAYLEQLNLELDAKRKQWLIIGVASILVLILGVLLFIISRKRNNEQKAVRFAEMQQLQKENEQKEHALQNTTMELVKSNTSFSQLLQNIEGLTSEMKVETKKKARSILMDFRAKLQDEIWQKFNLEFENANAGFYRELKSKFEGLTDSELRISAMHVSGLSNKEISAITGQQLNSLHTHKSRLRKKLGAKDDVRLMEILKSIQAHQLS